MPINYSPFLGKDATAVRYVALYGSDLNNGFSWERPKRTVAAAVNSLPQVGSGGSLRRSGTIYIGGGTFVETATPIEASSSIRFVGQGIGSDETTNAGTCIKLGDGLNTSLFSPSGSFTDYSHGLIFENIIFDGNKANNTSTTDPLVKIVRGGYNCRVSGCYFRNSNDVSLLIDIHAVNVAIEHCTFRESDSNAILFTPTLNSFMLNLFDIQFDNNVGSHFKVSMGSGSGDTRMDQINMSCIKAEATGAGQGVYVVEYVPRVAAFGNPTNFMIDGLQANATGGSAGVSAIRESSGTGISAKWSLTNISVNDYTSAFSSAKTGQASVGQNIRNGFFGPAPSSYAWTPSLELDSAILTAGTGTPEGVVTAPIGSLYLRLDGSTSTTLYVKTSGTGNTGWTAK